MLISRMGAGGGGSPPSTGYDRLWVKASSGIYGATIRSSLRGRCEQKGLKKVQQNFFLPLATPGKLHSSPGKPHLSTSRFQANLSTRNREEQSQGPGHTALLGPWPPTMSQPSAEAQGGGDMPLKHMQRHQAGVVRFILGGLSQG